MDDSQSKGNPYDFRSAIRHVDLLAGRDEELTEIDEFLRESASGRPVHISLFGGEGSGKSSLLNAVLELARRRGLLAIKLKLREAIVESELEFYRAVFDAAAQGLIKAGLIPDNDPIMQEWRARTCLGVLQGDVPDRALELGLLIAARLNGRMVSSVPTPLIQRDLERIVELAGNDIRGVVLCLDEAKALDENHDLAPSLLQLIDSSDLLTLVTAAEGAGSLQEAAPRAWAQVEVGAFKDPGQVMDAITKPIAYFEDSLGAGPPTPGTAFDIQELTGGVPYEVNLVCHYIWDALSRGEQDSFELSPAVIERVTRELEERGRHQATQEIATFSRLGVSDYQMLAELAPYEALTIRQLGLLRLMLTDYTDADLLAAENGVGSELDQLAKKGALRVERDRFEVVGGRDARLYLKYAYRQHADGRLRYGDTYADAATPRVAAQFAAALAREGVDESPILGMAHPRELGGAGGEGWLDSVCAAIISRDIVTLAETLAIWITPKTLLDSRGDSFLLLGLDLQVGLHYVEHFQLVANTDGRPIDEIRERANEWSADEAELLAKYDVSVVGWRCEEIPAPLLKAAVAYGRLRLASQGSYMLYRAGAVEPAEELLGTMLDDAEQLVGSEPSDPLVRTQLANALHRRGFMAATRGDWAVANERFERSRGMAVIDPWLLEFNIAYVLARTGDLSGASGRIDHALRQYVDGYEGVVLHAFLPTPDDWVSPGDRWNVVYLQGIWIKRFLEIQQLVLRAAHDDPAREKLAEALLELSASSPAPLLRLGAWAQLTVLGDRGAAVALFSQAVDGTPYDEARMPKLELEYARGKLSGPNGSTGDVPPAS